MRTIIQISCYALNGDCHINVTNKCLSFLIEVLPVMPAFEIFNCPLIDFLLNWLDHQEHHQKSLLCMKEIFAFKEDQNINCLLYTSPSPRDQRGSRMPSSA